MRLSKPVKKTRAGMVEFLKNHFRYNTMNGCNLSTSYAHNVKIHNVIPQELQNKAYEILDQGDVFDEINMLFDDFMREHNGIWQAGFNGRSGGYIVLYRGGSKPSEYKSYCKSCGQRNFKTTAETQDKKCGRCGENSRVDFTKIPTEYFCYPGKGVDCGEDFTEWSVDQLRERVRIVQEFDLLCDNAVNIFIDTCKNNEVIEEIIMIPKTVKRLRAK